MNDRPTEEQLEDPAETGRCGCLIPDIADDSSDETEEE